MAWLGDIQIELIQPIQGPGIYWEFLNNKGEGIHHIKEYVKDEDMEKVLNEYKQKMISWNGNKYWLYNRWPFLHKNNSNNWYELLKWDGLSWQCEYQKFFLYDIIETTLPFQKEAGEFYSMICCSKTSLLRYEDPSRIEERQRYIKAKTYCVKNRCWYKSVINDTPPYWYVNGLVKV